MSIVQHDPAVRHVVGFTGRQRRRRRDQHRHRVRRAEAARPSAAVDRPTVIGRLRRKLAAGARRAAVPAAGRRTSASAAGRATPPISTRCRATSRGALCTGRPSSRRAAEQSGAARRQFRPAGQGPGDRLMIDRDTAARLGSRRARSTTRCTTPSASARSRPSTARSTSTTSSWRWRRATGRAPRP